MKILYEVSYKNNSQPNTKLFTNKSRALDLYNKLCEDTNYETVKLSKEYHLTSSDVSDIIKA